MTEKHYAQNIQKELKDAIIAFSNDIDFLGCCINKPLKEINDLKLNIDTLIAECKLLNISVEYANKIKNNQRYWIKTWNLNPCLIFAFSDQHLL